MQYALFSELVRKYEQTGMSLANEPSDVMMAHVINSLWVVRFIQQNVKFLCGLTQRAQTSSVEVTCSSPAEIFNIVRA